MRVPIRKPGKYTHQKPDFHLTQKKLDEIKAKLERLKKTHPKAAALLKKNGFRSIDTRQRKLYDPNAGNRRSVVRIMRAAHAQWLALWAMRNFASASHFIATKV